MIYRRKNKLKLIINRTKLFWNIKSYNTIPTDLGTKAFRCLRCVTNEPNFISVFSVTRLSKRKDEERVQVDRTDNIKFKSSVLRQATSDIPPRQTSSTSSLLVIVGFPFLPLYIREGPRCLSGNVLLRAEIFCQFHRPCKFQFASVNICWIASKKDFDVPPLDSTSNALATVRSSKNGNIER